MKKTILLLAALCMLFSGCAKSETPAAPEKDTEVSQEPTVTLSPLPDTTMNDLNDAVLSVSFGAGDAYVDDTGKMVMKVKIYTYDKYDAVAISTLKEGDTLVTHGGNVLVNSIVRDASGTVCINGGLEAGGFDLVNTDTGVYYETGLNDAKNWYEVGEELLRVSVDFEARDNADPNQGEVVYYPGSFLTDEVKNYDFTPHNTTIRIAEGQVVELNRIFVP